MSALSTPPQEHIEEKLTQMTKSQIKDKIGNQERAKLDPLRNGQHLNKTKQERLVPKKRKMQSSTPLAISQNQIRVQNQHKGLSES
jgi:hypothetical protein